MRVDREALVRPAKQRRIRDVVRVKSDMSIISRNTFALHPGFDHSHLAGAVAIFTVDPGDDALVEPDQAVGRDDVVKAETLRDRLDVQAVGCGGEDEAIAFGTILLNALRARRDGRSAALSCRQNCRPPWPAACGRVAEPSSIHCIISFSRVRSISPGNIASVHSPTSGRVSRRSGLRRAAAWIRNGV